MRELTQQGLQSFGFLLQSLMHRPFLSFTAVVGTSEKKGTRNIYSKCDQHLNAVPVSQWQNHYYCYILHV